MPKLVAMLLSLVSAVFLQFGGSADAQTLRGVQQRILSQPAFGLMLGQEVRTFTLNIARPNIPRSPSQLDALQFLPIEKGSPIIYFPEGRVPYGGDDWVPIITEEGVWGMAPLNRRGQRNILTQTDAEVLLQEVRRGFRLWGIVERNVSIPGTAIALTRGEIYPFVRGERMLIITEKDEYFTGGKHAQILALGRPSEPLYVQDDRLYIPVPTEDEGSNLKQLDILRLNDYYVVIEEACESGNRSIFGIPWQRWTTHLFGEKCNAVDRARRMLELWRKYLYTNVHYSFDCNKIAKLRSESETRSAYSLEVKAGLEAAASGLTQFLGSLNVGISGSADWSASASETAETSVLFGRQSYEYDVVVMEQAGTPEPYVFGNSRDCAKADDSVGGEELYREHGQRFFRMTKPGVTGFLLEKSIFEAVDRDVDEVHWNGVAGKFEVACFGDYRRLANYLTRRLQLSDHETSHLLSRIMFTDSDARSFLSC